MLSRAILKATLRAMEARLDPATVQRDKYTAEVAELEQGIAEVKAELSSLDEKQSAA